MTIQEAWQNRLAALALIKPAQAQIRPVVCVRHGAVLWQSTARRIALG